MNVRVAAEERVKARFEPIPVAIAPRRELAARDVAFLEYERGLAFVGEKFRCCEAGGPGTDDEDVGFGGCDQRTNSWGRATVGTSSGIRPLMMISS